MFKGERDETLESGMITVETPNYTTDSFFGLEDMGLRPSKAN